MNGEKIYLAPFYLISAALVGVGDTFFLSYYQYFNKVPSCAIGGCETVLTSVYSKFMGVPLSYLGLLFYAYMLCLAALLAYDPESKGLRIAAVLYTGFALLLSLIFEFYIQLGLIGALCLYCAISALTTLALFSVSVWHFRSSSTSRT